VLNAADFDLASPLLSASREGRRFDMGSLWRHGGTRDACTLLSNSGHETLPQTSPVEPSKSISSANRGEAKT
jgi:hypothetical protein